MKLRSSLCAVFAALSVPAFATPTLESLNYVRFYGASDPQVLYACENTSGAACSGSVAVPGTNWVAQYEAHGSTAFGILKNYAAVSLGGDASGGAFPSFLSVGSRSGYIDSYTFTGGSGAGTAYFTFSIDGSAVSNGGAYGGTLLQVVPSVNGVLDWNAQRNYGVNNGKSVIAVPITFGTPTEMLIAFYALAQVISWEAGSSAVADYSHTAILSQIVVRDSQGALVNNFAIASGSGTSYSATGVVPEPASAALLFAGLGLMLITLRKCQKN
jgi:hypothetical protein